MSRILVDLKTNHKGEIVGRIDMPSDSVFVLESLAEIILQFSTSCEIPPLEIIEDLKGLLK